MTKLPGMTVREVLDELEAELIDHQSAMRRHERCMKRIRGVKARLLAACRPLTTIADEGPNGKAA